LYLAEKFLIPLKQFNSNKLNPNYMESYNQNISLSLILISFFPVELDYVKVDAVYLKGLLT
jgi:hypothetical protein